METRWKVSSGSEPLIKSNRGGQTAVQGTKHELRIAFFEREKQLKGKCDGYFDLLSKPCYNTFTYLQNKT